MDEARSYRIGEVAAMLGVSTHAIRAWEKRHHGLTPERSPSRQRRYRATDIALLREVKRAVDVSGMTFKLAFAVAGGAVAAEPGRPPAEPPSGGDPIDAGWRAFADMFELLVLILRPDGIILDANVAVARTTRLLRERLHGMSIVNLVDPADAPKALRMCRRMSGRWELTMPLRSGPRLHSFDCWPVRHEGQRLLVAVGSETRWSLCEARSTGDAHELNGEARSKSSFKYEAVCGGPVQDHRVTWLVPVSQAGG